MHRQSILVTNKVGLHARPASEFVKEASRFTSQIQIRNLTTGSDWINAKSIISLLSLGVERGHKIEICAQGNDEQAALQALIHLIQSDFKGRL